MALCNYAMINILLQIIMK